MSRNLPTRRPPISWGFRSHGNVAPEPGPERYGTVDGCRPALRNRQGGKGAGMNETSVGGSMCERTMRELDLHLGEEPLSAIPEVLEHFRQCAACSKELEDRKRMRDRFRSRSIWRRRGWRPGFGAAFASPSARIPGTPLSSGSRGVGSEPGRRGRIRIGAFETYHRIPGILYRVRFEPCRGGNESRVRGSRALLVFRNSPRIRLRSRR